MYRINAIMSMYGVFCNDIQTNVCEQDREIVDTYWSYCCSIDRGMSLSFSATQILWLRQSKGLVHFLHTWNQD